MADDVLLNTPTMHYPQRHFPVACNSVGIIQFLDSISRRYAAPTTVIICSSREDFVEHLHRCMEAEQFNSEQEPEPIPDESGSKEPHRLLVPTLQSISTSRSINLAFAPNLAHLRAYLSVYRKPSVSPGSASQTYKAGSHEPILAVWDLISLHSPTDELSAQGLSRTLASAVEAAERSGQRLFVLDPEAMPPESRVETSAETARHPWKERIPLLSSSVKSNLGQRALSGRNIEVGVVLSKWCRLERADCQESTM